MGCVVSTGSTTDERRGLDRLDQRVPPVVSTSSTTDERRGLYRLDRRGHRTIGLDDLDKPADPTSAHTPRVKVVNARELDNHARATPRRLRWWVRDREGRLAVAQFPNPALGIWLVARLLEWSDLTSLDDATLRHIGTGALLVWALDELLRGTSPFRRVLGAVVLGAQLAALFV
jgi:hypothetical protein